MEEKLEPQQIALEFIKKNLLFVGLISLGILLVIIGLFQYFSSKSSTSDIEFTSTSTKEAVGADIKGASTSSTISVDVEGKVLHPGVYSLPQGSRIQDALIAAGGMSSSADRVYISKHLNQAQKIVDGGKIYIPALGEAQTTTIPAQSDPIDLGSESTSSTDNSGMININSASEGQLDTLPKVGPVTARKIIAGRPYGNINELVTRKIMGQKTFDGLKEKIMVE